MKVILSDTSTSWLVVDDSYGSKGIKDGMEYTFRPLPLAKIPIGFGRMSEQAKELAELICDLLNDRLECDLDTYYALKVLYGLRNAADHPGVPI
jgi:hypothetical protein